MKRKVSILPEAQRDIKEAATWYEAREPGLGARFRSDLRATLQRIRTDALMFLRIDETVRRALLGKFPYSVYFIVRDKTAVIPAVLHQHRHPNAWKPRL